MSFSDFYVTPGTRKRNFLNQTNQLIDSELIDQIIRKHYNLGKDAAGRPAYSGLLLFKMLMVAIWNGGLSDESIEDMANSNLHVMRFLELALEDDVPDHSILSRFRTALTKANAWDGLLKEMNPQIESLSSECHVDASITHSPRKPKTKPTYEIVIDRNEAGSRYFCERFFRAPARKISKNYATANACDCPDSSCFTRCTPNKGCTA